MQNFDKLQQSITREQSAILQGVAVLLMIHHHFFNDISIYGEQLLFWNAKFVMHFAWFGKICVGIFAFVSGYGMCRVLEKRKGKLESFWKTFGDSYLACVSQFGQLLIRYWILLLVFMPLFFLLGKKEFALKEFLENFFCVSTTYNGAFWYVGQYGIMLMLLPLLHMFCIGLSPRRTKQGNGAFVKAWKCFYFGLGACVFFLCVILLLCHKWNWILFFVKSLRPAFLMVFIVGYLLAWFGWFDHIYAFMKRQNKIVRMGAGCGLLLTVFLIRMALADSPAYATLDFVFVPVFVLGILVLTDELQKVGKALGWIGNMTVYLWLTHLFIYDLTMNGMLKIGRSHFFFWIAELALCILTAWCCKILENLFRRKRSHLVH